MGDDKDSEPEGIEMQQKAPAVTDKKSSTTRGVEKEDVSVPVSSTAEKDKPPEPPKRDYDIENATVEQSEEGYARVKKKSKLSSFPRPEIIYKPETTESWMSCLRNTLVVFNLLIWVLGAVLTALGVWIKVDSEFLDIQTGLNTTQFKTSAHILIATGVIIMIVGFLGCYGAIASKIWMLILFAVIVVIIILLEITVMAIVWTGSTNKDVKEDIKLRARQAMFEMRKDDGKRYLIDLLQAKLKCCGVDGPGDYSLDEETPMHIPTSCTNEETGGRYQKGCFDAAVEYFKSKAAVLGGLAVSVFILQLGALVFTVCLACGLKQAATSSI
ncbi:CD9 antigen, partial [Stegodyphus mimosarum]